MSWFNRWIFGWIEVAEGFVMIVTFTKIKPVWTMKFLGWTFRRLRTNPK